MDAVANITVQTTTRKKKGINLCYDKGKLEKKQYI